MAERKAVNKYYPPDYDPRKGSINKHVGQHPLRDRAKKISQGILVIRFEMPYNIWCGGCGSHIGMGVRYNAEKSKVGNYYTTPIYKFRMKCHLCDQYFEIQTDPQNHDYVILSGARRKEQRWDPKANGQVVPEDKATQKKLATDAMFKLEHGSDDTDKGKKAISTLAQLELRREEWKDDYILNREARNKFRAEKNAMKEETAAEKAFLEKRCLPMDIILAPETEEDSRLAGLLKYSVVEAYDEKQKERRKAIDHRPLFESPKPKDPSPSTTQAGASGAQLKLKRLGLTTLSKLPNPFDTSPSPATAASSSRLRSQQLGIVWRKADPSQAENSCCSTGPEDSEEKGDAKTEFAMAAQDAADVEQQVMSLEATESKGDKQGSTAENLEKIDLNTSVTLSEGNALNSLIAMYSDSDSEDKT